MNELWRPADAEPIDRPSDLPLAIDLARMISVDPATGDLVLQNGEARLVLKRDGTIRVEGRRIVGMADETIALHAAIIDLN
jgi:hypothetical protein